VSVLGEPCGAWTGGGHNAGCGGAHGHGSTHGHGHGGSNDGRSRLRIEGGEVGVGRLLLAAQEAAAQQQAAQQQRNEQQEQEEQKEELVAILGRVATGAWNDEVKGTGAEGRRDEVVAAAGRHEAGGAAGGQGDAGESSARANDEQLSGNNSNGLAKSTGPTIYWAGAVEAISEGVHPEIELDGVCCLAATVLAHVVKGNTI